MYMCMYNYTGTCIYHTHTTHTHTHTHTYTHTGPKSSNPYMSPGDSGVQSGVASGAQSGVQTKAHSEVAPGDLEQLDGDDGAPNQQPFGMLHA